MDVLYIYNLLWACPLVVLYNMSAAGVRVVEFGTNCTFLCRSPSSESESETSLNVMSLKCFDAVGWASEG